MSTKYNTNSNAGNSDSSPSKEININGVTCRTVNMHATCYSVRYDVCNTYHLPTRSLIDRGENGGVAGNNI